VTFEIPRTRDAVHEQIVKYIGTKGFTVDSYRTDDVVVRDCSLMAHRPAPIRITTSCARVATLAVLRTS